jgi:hypothetical protein
MLGKNISTQNVPSEKREDFSRIRPRIAHEKTKGREFLAAHA